MPPIISHRFAQFQLACAPYVRRGSRHTLTSQFRPLKAQSSLLLQLIRLVAIAKPSKRLEGFACCEKSFVCQTPESRAYFFVAAR
jgi:hypothetical protein